MKIDYYHLLFCSKYDITAILPYYIFDSIHQFYIKFLSTSHCEPSAEDSDIIQIQIGYIEDSKKRRITVEI